MSPHLGHDADSDPAFHFDVDPDPDPAFYFDAVLVPDPACQNDVDPPDPQHRLSGSPVMSPWQLNLHTKRGQEK
jgi:hypothetical protein